MLVLEDNSAEGKNVYQLLPYQYNVLRAFLHGGYTQHKGHTDSHGGVSCPQVGGVGLRADSTKVPRLPGLGSSCFDSASLHGGPCPIQSGGNAPTLTACSSARLPVST